MCQKLDDKHKAYFKILYTHEQLYRVFIRQPVTFKSSYDFESLYQGCLTNNKVEGAEYINSLNKEMQKFNGKISVGEDATTGSDMTSQTGVSKSRPARSFKSSLKAGSNLVTAESPLHRGEFTPTRHDADSILGLSPSPSKERLDEARGEDMGAPRLNRKVLIKLEGEDMQNKILDLEDEEEDRRAQDEEERKQREKSPLKELYRDKNGVLFDPNKKFGQISPEKELIYDNITSSYEVNLPQEYYRNYVQDNLPKKDEA